MDPLTAASESLGLFGFVFEFLYSETGASCSSGLEMELSL